MRQIPRLFVNFMLCFSIAFTPTAVLAQSPSAHVFFETNVADIDSTRLTLDFGEISLAELGRLPERMGDHPDILPQAQQKLQVHVFVPVELPPADRLEFLSNVQEQLSQSNPQLQVELQVVELDLEQARLDHEKANEGLRRAAEALQQEDHEYPAAAASEALQKANNQKFQSLKAWGAGFRSSIFHYNQWFKASKKGHTKAADERIGSWIGKARGMVSAAVWFGFNSLSVGAMAQVSAAFFLDWFFSKYERRVDIFKGTHRIPLENIPVIGHAVRFYNERPLLKSWIVGNLIGFAAGSYFRFWSWFENPERTSPPWSWDALATFTSVVGIGNLAAAFGAQGPRILRKKGYVSSRVEYYIYVSYGALFQAGGFLYGLGSDLAVVAFATTESLIKVGLYGVARSRPWKGPRALIFHPALTNQAVEELLYRVGFEHSEITAMTRNDLSDFIQRLKREQSLDWKAKVRRTVAKLPGCSSLLEN